MKIIPTSIATSAVSALLLLAAVPATAHVKAPGSFVSDSLANIGETASMCQAIDGNIPQTNDMQADVLEWLATTYSTEAAKEHWKKNLVAAIYKINNYSADSSYVFKLATNKHGKQLSYEVSLKDRECISTAKQLSTCLPKLSKDIQRSLKSRDQCLTDLGCAVCVFDLT